MVYVFDAKLLPGSDPRVDWGGGNFPLPKFIEVPSDGLPKIGPAKAGVPVDGTDLPKKIVWDDKPIHPPADIDNSPYLNLSERAKAVIEAIEPGVHQFFPVEYVDRKGGAIETRYWLYICNRRDAIHPTRSNMILNRFGEFSPPMDGVRRGWEIPAHIDVNAPPRFVVDGSKVDGAHLWREVRAEGLPLVSDVLHQAIIDAELTGYYPGEEIEVV